MTVPRAEVIDLSKDRKPRPKRPCSKDDLSPLAIIIALDPGGTTGWSLMGVRPEALHNPKEKILDNIVVFKHGQVDCGSTKGNLGTNSARAADRASHEGVSTSGEAAGVNDLISLIRSWPSACILIEDFIVRQYNQSRDFLSPVRITAALGQSLWWDRRAYFVQQPAEAKTTATDERLKRWGMYSSAGGMNHARDADRHAITFLRKAKADRGKGKAVPPIRERAWPYLFDERATVET